MKIAALFCHPIKGFSPLGCSHLAVSPTRGGEGDRRWAIAHGEAANPQEPACWLPRRHFLNVAHHPKLGTLEAHLDLQTDQLSLSRHGQLLYTGQILPGQVDEALSALLAAHATVPPPYRWVQLPDQALTDNPQSGLSIMNLNSLHALSEKVGFALAPERFRGNVWLEGVPEWDEMTWIGQSLQLGAVTVEVLAPIARCAAIEVDLHKGERGAPVLKPLHTHWGHTYFGVLAKVLSPGDIQVGKAVKIGCA